MWLWCSDDGSKPCSLQVCALCGQCVGVVHTAIPTVAGFSVYGSAPRGELLSKAGLQSGQALILTKPVGTGRCSTCQRFGTVLGKRWLLSS